MAQQPTTQTIPQILEPQKAPPQIVLPILFHTKLNWNTKHPAQHQHSRALKNTEFSISRVGLVLEETNMSSLSWQVGKQSLKKPEATFYFPLLRLRTCPNLQSPKTKCPLSQATSLSWNHRRKWGADLSWHRDGVIFQDVFLTVKIMFFFLKGTHVSTPSYFGFHNKYLDVHPPQHGPAGPSDLLTACARSCTRILMFSK